MGIKDSDGKIVTSGCHVYFSYGIPPVGVLAKVIERDGNLIALTPGHNPKECPVADLKKNVCEFRVASPSLPLAHAVPRGRANAAASSGIS